MPPKARAPTKLSSHTVLAIDKSGSMRNVDVTIGLVPGQNISRNTALFDCLQGQFFPQQEANDHDATDVYSMIVFSDEARVAYLHEPLSSAKEKTISAAVDRPESHGYYLPTLKSLGQILDLPLSLTAAATMVLFLSDGKPSDALPRGKEDATTKLTGFIVRPALAAMGRSLDSANQGKSIFSFHSMGFGPLTEFGVLKSMAESIPNGMGTFHVAALNIRDFRKTLSSFSSSITESRLSSKQIGPARPLREVKMIPKYQTSAVSYQFYEGVTHFRPATSSRPTPSPTASCLWSPLFKASSSSGTATAATSRQTLASAPSVRTKMRRTKTRTTTTASTTFEASQKRTCLKLFRTGLTFMVCPFSRSAN